MKGSVSRCLPKGRIGRSVLILFSGTAAAQALTALSLPIVTRLYTPEMIGVISIYLSFFNFWSGVSTWRYESALLISVDEDESHQIFRVGALLTVIMATLAVPTIYILIRYEVLGFSVLPEWSPIVAFLSLLGFGWFMMYRSWALRLQQIHGISLATISRSAANSGTRVVTGLLTGQVFGLFIAEILGSWSALSSLRKRVRKHLKLRPVWSFVHLTSVAAKYKKFAKYEMPSTMVNQLAIALPIPMVAALYGAQAAGWFGLARLLYAIPNTQLGKSIGDVFQMELGKCIRERKLNQGLELFKRFSIRLFIVGIAILTFVTFLAPSLVPVIFGVEWKPMGRIMVYIAPWMTASLVVSSMSRTLSVLQRQEWKLIYDSIYLLIVTAVFIWSKYFDAELMDFIFVLSLSMIGAYSIYFLIIYQAITRATFNPEVTS